MPATKRGLPNVQALGALVIDDSGREVYSRNADRERPIASISKLAATLAVMGKGLELDGLSTITREDTDVARRGAKSRLLCAHRIWNSTRRERRSTRPAFRMCSTRTRAKYA